MERSPLAAFSSLWPTVHGEPQAELPGLGEFLSLLLARGVLPEMRVVATHGWAFDSAEDARQAALRRLWIAPEGSKADRLRAALGEGLIPNDSGVRLPHRSRVGLVTWSPADAQGNR